MPRRYEAIIGLLLLMPIITSNIRIKTLRTFWAMLKIKECHPIISYALIKERYVPESIVRGTSMLNALRNTAISVLWNIWADINPESRKRRMPPMMLETSIIEEEIPNTYLIFLASFLPLNMEIFVKGPVQLHWRQCPCRSSRRLWTNSNLGSGNDADGQVDLIACRLQRTHDDFFRSQLQPGAEFLIDQFRGKRILPEWGNLGPELDRVIDFIVYDRRKKFLHGLSDILDHAFRF